jgi:hypothetical protein
MTKGHSPLLIFPRLPFVLTLTPYTLRTARGIGGGAKRAQRAEAPESPVPALGGNAPKKSSHFPTHSKPAILSLKKHLPNLENLKIVINLEIFYPR